MNLYQKIALAAGISISVVVVVIVILNSAEEKVETFDPEAVEMLRDYRGPDDGGKSLRDILGEKFAEDYPDETALGPDASIMWFAYEDESQGKKLVKVGYSIKTAKEDNEYIWYLDKNTGEVMAGNSLAQEILDRLES